MLKAILALEDGTIFAGRAFAGKGEAAGEVVFNTSMTGYQEILTDPSYRGQIVTMTYPLIGNYGVNDEDVESGRCAGPGLYHQGIRAGAEQLAVPAEPGRYLESQGVIGIEGIDTRALTRHLRVAGAMKGVLSTEDLDPESLVARAKTSPGLVGRDLVREVTCPSSHEWPVTVREKEDPVPGRRVRFRREAQYPELRCPDRVARSSWSRRPLPQTRSAS